MSGFDIGIRSQQQAQQSNQFYDAQRYQAMQGLGDTIRTAPVALQQMRQRNEMMQIEQAKAESALRLQEAEITAQADLNKLNAMLMIDQVDMSRTNVEAQKLQLEMQRYDFDERQRMAGENQRNKTLEVASGLIRSAGGTQGLYDMGWVVGDDGIPRKAKDKSELDSYLERMKASSDATRRTNDSTNVYGLTIQRELSAIDRAIEEGYLSTEEEAAALKRRNELMRAQSGLTNSVTGLSDQPTSPAPKPRKATEPNPKRDALVQRLNSAQATLVMNGMSPGILDPEQMATALDASRAEIRAEWRKNNTGDRAKANLSDDYIDSQIETILASARPEDQELREALMIWLYMKGQR